MLGEIKNIAIYKCSDLSFIEIVSTLPLVVGVLLLGIFPGLVTEYYDNNIIMILTKIGYGK